MKLKVQLIIESDSGEAEVMHEVAKLERPSLRTANLGLMLSEAKELLQEVQKAMVTHQTAQYLTQQMSCPECGESARTKGSIKSCCGRSSASCDLIVLISTIADVAARRSAAASVRLQNCCRNEQPQSWLTWKASLRDAPLACLHRACARATGCSLPVRMPWTSRSRRCLSVTCCPDRTMRAAAAVHHGSSRRNVG